MSGDQTRTDSSVASGLRYPSAPVDEGQQPAGISLTVTPDRRTTETIDQRDECTEFAWILGVE